LTEDETPIGESLKETIDRVVIYWQSEILDKIKTGKKVLIVAHGNSLRALIKHIENLSNEELIDLNIPTGVPLVYEFDEDIKVIKKYYLGDEAKVQQEIEKVANQGKNKS